MSFDSVPQMQQQQAGNRRILTSSQHSELEMARRRAEKAAEGKRANAEAAKQRFKRKKGERAEAARLEPEDRQGNEEIEHKLSVVEDQKEAKRLKRYPYTLHFAQHFLAYIIIKSLVPLTCHQQCLHCAMAHPHALTETHMQ